MTSAIFIDFQLFYLIIRTIPEYTVLVEYSAIRGNFFDPVVFNISRSTVVMLIIILTVYIYTYRNG